MEAPEVLRGFHVDQASIWRAGEVGWYLLRMTDWHHTAAAAAARAPIPPNPAALLLAHGTMELEWYAPRGEDPQTPHDQDELYFVVTGSGRFVRGEETITFGPGDAIFVPAGVEHRFVDFSDDFGTWVVFWGPTGGE